VSVADAVKRVSEINDWRALEAAKAEQAGMLENLAANSRLADPTAKLSFVEKPGLTWVDVPEVVNEKGTKLCTDIGKAGGWCTMNTGTAREYGSGDRRLVALLDSEGRPHAQAMIEQSRQDPASELYRTLDENTTREINAAAQANDPRGIDWGPKGEFHTGEETDLRRNLVREEMHRRFPQLKDAKPPPNIEELKPPGNSFSSDRSEVYKKRDPEYKEKVSESVLKFLNSGEWGNVNDLHQYNIFDLKNHKSHTEIENVFGNLGLDSFIKAIETNGGTPPVRFMTRDQLRDFIWPNEIPAEGYAKGGSVNFAPPSYAYSRSKQMFTNPFYDLV
jgi:hypothetical protein